MNSLEALAQALTTDPHGLCGRQDPAAALESITDGEIRLKALTLGVILEVLPAGDQWPTIAGLNEHWLLDPFDVAYRRSQEVLAAMRSEGIRGGRHNARVWWQICRGIQGRFKGAVRDLLRASGDDAPGIQTYLTQNKATFPVLSGPVISARWLDRVHRIGGVPLSGWEDLRVTLSDSGQKAAQLFEKPVKQAHPQIALALSIWSASCQRIEASSCGLANCPRR